MGSIIIHAGMPKTGSSAIQSWLADNSRKLRKEGMAVAVVEPGRGVVPFRLDYHERGGTNSSLFSELYHHRVDQRPLLLEVFMGRLERMAEENPTVVLSGEGLAAPFARLDELFLAALDELSRRHPVRVAYYVRPQHTALEAAWRQWGFRHSVAPRRYLAQRSRQLRYARTLGQVTRLTELLAFEPAPFVSELLLSGNVVADFANRFLALGDAKVDPERYRVNRGLPLEVVNALRGAPPGLLWDSPHDNSRLVKLQKAFARIEVPPHEDTQRSRQILQSHCYEVFEPGNQSLIAKLGWGIEHMVPPPPPGAEGGSLQDLDELWDHPLPESVAWVVQQSLAMLLEPAQEE